MDLHKKFKMFLVEKDMKAKEFAEGIGIHPGYFSQVMSGKLFPGMKLIEEIEKATGKHIRRSDFVRQKNRLNQKQEEENKNQSENQE